MLKTYFLLLAEYYGVEKTIEKEFEVFAKKGDAGGVVPNAKALKQKMHSLMGQTQFTELNGAHD